MTEEAWLKITPNNITRIRKINKIVETNPQWWVLELFDGFGPHVLSLEAMKE